jgi:hypothetical protein
MSAHAAERAAASEEPVTVTGSVPRDRLNR